MDNHQEYMFWLDELTKIVMDELGFDMRDLPDAPTRAAFEDGIDPEEAFQDFCSTYWEYYDPERQADIISDYLSDFLE